MRVPLLVSLGLAVTVGPLHAQAWNDAVVRDLVARGIARRASDAASGLRDFRARAHGFVFFLAQLGEEGLAEPPRLVKSDQLELEVYWKAPGRSKQRILGWRDRAELPTDIQYHRDHLGIVMNGFADRIRLGEGDEVRDVPHPLAADGPDQYDYALVDSLVIGLPDRTVRALEVAFRPRDFAAPRIVGSLFLDADGGDLVRLEFSFTRASYLDESLEDIAVVLEQGLWDGSYWLPRRQEIEIRRRTTWLDLPARGIIRGRWEIAEYAFNQDPPDRLFLGPEIVALPGARDSFPWPEPLDAAVGRELGPQRILRMDEVRSAAQTLVGPRSLSGLRSHGPSVRSASEVLRVNRVDGLRVGLGYRVRPGAGPFSARGWGAWAFAAQRVTGGLELGWRGGTAWAAVTGEREVRDLADEPAISGVLNSFLAQELGHDYGDYVLLDRVRVAGGWRGATARVGYERTDSLAAVANSVTGSYAPNPPLGSGAWWTAGLTLRGRSGGIVGAVVSGTLDLEVAAGGDLEYARVRAGIELTRPLGPGTMAIRGWGGWGSADLAPHRSFVLGGRGTLVGEPYRAFGGRHAALGRLEWQIAAPAPAIPLGRYASTGRQALVAPFVAVGWTGAPIAGLPWAASDGARPVLGVSAEVFHRLLQLEFGWAPRDGRVGFTVDVRRDLWPLL